MFSNLTHPCPHSRNFIIASVMLCNNRQLLRLKKCAINLNTPPLHRCNVHLHSYIRRSSLNYPDPPFVYVSGATHSAQPCTETRAFFSLLPSLPSYSFCCPRLYSMANHSAEVYLNPSLKFTLPRPYLNRACHLFYTKHSSPLAGKPTRVTTGNVYSHEEQRAEKKRGEPPSCNLSPVFPVGTPYCLLPN